MCLDQIRIDPYNSFHKWDYIRVNPYNMKLINLIIMSINI